MTEFTWFIMQWVLFFAVVAALAVRVWRDGELITELHRENDRRQRRLWETCLHLRAARRQGQVLDPYVDGLVDRTLAECPRSASGEHELRDDGESCVLCGLGQR